MHFLFIAFRVITVFLLFFPFICVFAQQKEQTGWAAWFNSYRFSSHLGLHLDVQVRSADRWEYARNLLVRPGFTYYFNNQHNVTLGYALVRTYSDPDLSPENNLTEHRLWEQYIYAQKVGRLPLAHRFRVEQRFIGRTGEDIFAQRLRYFTRLIIPCVAKETFNRGLFMAAQNEIFLNLGNKEKLNHSLFDQNRAYLALGYRLNEKADVEGGYLLQYIKGADYNVRNNVVQIAIYTRF